MKFNFYTPGTRVIYTGRTRSYDPMMVKGERGTIVMVIKNDGRDEGEYAYEVGVDWDEPHLKRHNCNGAAREGHGWWVLNGDVTLEPKKESKKKGRKDL